ncbi:MAG: hypothetical protein CL471_18615 [Acidobacteria bacterium]|nr:hypothetical protein [Acidobacteriota bacterium]
MARVLVGDREVVPGGSVARVEFNSALPAVLCFAPQTTLRDLNAEFDLLPGVRSVVDRGDRRCGREGQDEPHSHRHIPHEPPSDSTIATDAQTAQAVSGGPRGPAARSLRGDLVVTRRDTVALALLRGFPGRALPEALRLATSAPATRSCGSLTQLVRRLGLGLPGACIRDARERADESLARAEEQGVRPVTWTDRAYPPCLAAIADPPPVLWLRGHLEVLDTPSVAIVGSRTASRYARDVAEQLGSDLADRGVTVVSGLARGVDSAAHRGALDGGRTVAVLGSSVELVYPPEHTDLAEAIAAKGGAVVSEFPPETPPRPAHFPSATGSSAVCRWRSWWSRRPPAAGRSSRSDSRWIRGAR